MSRWPGSARVWAAATGALLLLSGCSPSYVLRAGYEEAKILWRRQPIETVLQDPDLDAATREKLELVLAARVFARESLQLRVGGSYATLSRVDADQVVHVVTAAYRDRLEPHTWWFPIVGRVPYKGYFSAADAEAEAAALEAAGFDTAVRPSVAFSTLGWFDDPLLSTLLRYDAANLVETVIHELLHNTVYPAGQAAFNESFATFVGHRGAMSFFAGRSDEARRQQTEAAWAAELIFSDFLGRFAARLRAAYAAGAGEAERQELFAAAQAECRELPLGGAYRRFYETPLNNAIILHYLLYGDRLRMFDAVLARYGNDLPRTIAAITAAARVQPSDPFAGMADLLSQ